MGLGTWRAGFTSPCGPSPAPTARPADFGRGRPLRRSMKSAGNPADRPIELRVREIGDADISRLLNEGPVILGWVINWRPIQVALRLAASHPPPADIHPPRQGPYRVEKRLKTRRTGAGALAERGRSRSIAAKGAFSGGDVVARQRDRVDADPPSGLAEHGRGLRRGAAALQRQLFPI